MTHDERQSGGRVPAPGRLALAQAFVNSRWDLDRGQQDRFADPPSLARWLVKQELLAPGTGLDANDLRRAVRLREDLRQLLYANNGHPADPDAVTRLNAELRSAGVSVRLGASQPPEFVPLHDGLDGALAAVAMIVATAQIDGSWRRLKACPGRDCGWVFYDHSRNLSGTWCSMSVCGQREKARSYRSRRR